MPPKVITLEPARTNVDQSGDYALVERAYLAIDAIDSTRWCTRTGDLAGYRWLRAYLDGLCRAVRDHGGEIVKTLGDGLEACFMDAADALDCSLAVFHAADVERSAVRIGLVYGQLIRYTIDSHVDYFGREVILASRLSRHGVEPGVFMTTGLIDRLSAIAPGCVGVNLPASEIKVKGLDEPVLIYRLPERPRSRAHPACREPLPAGGQHPGAMHRADRPLRLSHV